MTTRFTLGVLVIATGCHGGSPDSASNANSAGDPNGRGGEAGHQDGSGGTSDVAGAPSGGGRAGDTGASGGDGNQVAGAGGADPCYWPTTFPIEVKGVSRPFRRLSSTRGYVCIQAQVDYHGALTDCGGQTWIAPEIHKEYLTGSAPPLSGPDASGRVIESLEFFVAFDLEAPEGMCPGPWSWQINFDYGCANGAPDNEKLANSGWTGEQRTGTQTIECNQLPFKVSIEYDQGENSFGKDYFDLNP